MKAILEFNLPEDQEDFEMAQNGSSYSCVLHTFDQQRLRPITKHSIIEQDLMTRIKDSLASIITPDKLPAPEVLEDIAVTVVEYVRDQLYEVASDYDVTVV